MEEAILFTCTEHGSLEFSKFSSALLISVMKRLNSISISLSQKRQGKSSILVLL